MVTRICLLVSTLFQVSSLPADVPLSQQVRVPGPHPYPTPQLFAEGIVSGPGGDGSPTFSPDGNRMLFTRSAAQWTIILEAHRTQSGWSKPVPASFSGEWPDSSPSMSPDGSFLVFQSTRPVDSATMADGAAPHPVSNLWRVDWLGSQWGRPTRLPDSVNIGHSIWKPSVGPDATLYFTFIDPKGNKRLYSSKFVSGTYQIAQPLSFSDGNTLDVDPAIEPNGWYLVFSSAGRIPGDSKDHLFIVNKTDDGWASVARLRYIGDDVAGGSNDDDPHFGPDRQTLYFSSDRSVPVHFPRTHDQALKDTERMERWDNGNTNVWSFPVLFYM